jgi:hypothetical protein
VLLQLNTRTDAATLQQRRRTSSAPTAAVVLSISGVRPRVYTP